MDDSYIIVRTKDEANELLKDLNKITKENGLFLNMKKTRIEKIHNNWITFLKIKYFITSTYKIIEKPVSETFRREYKRINTLYKLYKNNNIKLDYVLDCYKSWRGSYRKFDCGYEIKNLDSYITKLFDLKNNYNFN